MQLSLFKLNFVVSVGNNYRFTTKVSRLDESRAVNFYILGSRFQAFTAVTLRLAAYGVEAHVRQVTRQISKKSRTSYFRQPNTFVKNTMRTLGHNIKGFSFSHHGQTQQTHRGRLITAVRYDYVRKRVICLQLYVFLYY